jgi:hypothetical protein
MGVYPYVVAIIEKMPLINKNWHANCLKPNMTICKLRIWVPEFVVISEEYSEVLHHQACLNQSSFDFEYVSDEEILIMCLISDKFDKECFDQS